MPWTMQWDWEPSSPNGKHPCPPFFLVPPFSLRCEAGNGAMGLDLRRDQQWLLSGLPCFFRFPWPAHPPSVLGAHLTSRSIVLFATSSAGIPARSADVARRARFFPCVVTPCWGSG